MSATKAASNSAAETQSMPRQKRKLKNALWEPFLQFKLLMYMLGLTAIVAVTLIVFMYFSFGGLLDTLAVSSGGSTLFEEEVRAQLVNLFRYCGALFLLYIVLLAAVCVAYTHRLIGPFKPFNRHVDALAKGDYSHRVVLRKGDVQLQNDFATKLNELAVHLETKDKHS